MTVDSRPGLSRPLSDTGVIAIVRGSSGARTAAVVTALVEAGLRSVEITLNTPGALEALRAARRRFGSEVEVGAGTVRAPDQVDAAARAGAAYVVSPHTSARIGARAGALGLGWFPGAYTATEVVTAWELGAAAVKLFPASAGGPRYVRELLAPLDDVRLIPTGGVDASNAGEFVAAGAVAVGAGGGLIRDALNGGSLTALADRARALLEAVAKARA
ncbi:MAG TPA: bifunctional 4-hydroxy-2-oxoglutarate aldolase/2-dehydro-3-deoxy-phosphogluconate aldolase [Pilimelia sp.]|nr:bifunctional 4-hydroxy-2-oxoglutarate aldolase/2-dehydro-3-deoxy-phosphogluconate aldolase [Pilimelia sp.]